MKRLLSCSGSVYLDPEPESEETSYATEGTAAHFLWHAAWLLGKDPSYFRGQLIGDIPVTEEMIAGAKMFLDRVRFEMERVDATDNDIYLEQKIYHPDDNSRGGTPDCIIVGKKGIVVVDYKYGAGRLVLADDPQLLEYLLLGRENYKSNVVMYRAVVVQPRLENFQGFEREIDYDEKALIRHDEEVMHTQRCVDFNNVSFNVGGHCWKCPAMGTCDAIYLSATKLAETFHGEDMDAEKANDILGKEEAIKAYLKYTREWEFRRLNSGGEPIDYHLETTRSQSKFDIPETDLVMKAIEAGIDPELLYKKKLLTVNQLKKVVGEEFVNTVASVHTGGKKMVKLTDEPEQAQRAVTAASAFADVQMPEL